METKQYSLETQRTEALTAAAQTLAEGALVAFPTETVYGLGALAQNADAVRRIFEAKGRPADNPLIVHVATLAQAQSLCRDWTAHAQALARAFWPGPLSLIVSAQSSIPSVVTAGLDSVAVRMPDHADALALIRLSGPIAAPSANTSGRPSPVTAEHVFEDMNGRIPIILNGGPCRIGVESTVVDVRGQIPVILRPGGITCEQIKAVCGDCAIADGVLSPVHGQALSPGMLHRHYAPRGQTTLVWPDPHQAHTLCDLYDTAQSIGLSPVILCESSLQAKMDNRHCLILNDAGDMSHGLFAALRRADEAGYDRVFIQGIEPEGKGLAYMNRALRAAGFDIAQQEMNILFVCTGNTCRSAMAECLCRMLSLKNRWPVIAHSAGTHAYAGMSATEESLVAVRSLGADLNEHTTKPLSRALIEEADLVLCMTERNLSDVLRLCPTASDKSSLLLEWAYCKREEVRDPFGHSLSVYRDCAQQILDALRTGLLRKKYVTFFHK